MSRAPHRRQIPSDEDRSSPSPPLIRFRRPNVRLRSPSPEEPRRRAQPRAGATAPVRRRPPPTLTPRQPRFTADGRPIFEIWMDAATRLASKWTGSSCTGKAARPVGCTGLVPARPTYFNVASCHIAPRPAAANRKLRVDADVAKWRALLMLLGADGPPWALLRALLILLRLWPSTGATGRLSPGAPSP